MLSSAPMLGDARTTTSRASSQPIRRLHMCMRFPFRYQSVKGELDRFEQRGVRERLREASARARLRGPFEGARRIVGGHQDSRNARGLRARMTQDGEAVDVRER